MDLKRIPKTDANPFIEGMGSILDFTGSGDFISSNDLYWRSTSLFQGSAAPVFDAAEGSSSDWNALMNDWQKVGDDLRGALDGYRQSAS